MLTNNPYIIKKSAILLCSLLLMVIPHHTLAASISDEEEILNAERRLAAAEKSVSILSNQLGIDAPKAQTLNEKPIIVAQSRIGELQLRLNTVEQQLRTMTGQLQELQFQMQQMQQQFQNYAQDSEYRFQQLEGSQGSQLQRDPPQSPQIQDENTLPNNLDLPETFQDEGQPLDLRNIFKDSLLDFGIEPQQGDTYEDHQLAQAQDLISRGENIAAKDMLTAMMGLEMTQDQKIQAFDLLGTAHYNLSDYSTATNTWLEGYRLSETSSHAPKLLMQLATAMSAIGEKESACSMAEKIDTDFSTSSDVTAAIYIAESRELRSRLNCRA